MKHFVKDPVSGEIPRFLLVEDEAMLAMYMEDILLSLDCDVVKAARVDQAIATLGSHRIDGAFLDVSVSGAAVFPLADVLRSRSIPFSFVTGHDPDRLPAAYRNCVILSKPIVEREFRRVALTIAARAMPTPDRSVECEMQDYAAALTAG